MQRQIKYNVVKNGESACQYNNMLTITCSYLYSVWKWVRIQLRKLLIEGRQ